MNKEEYLKKGNEAFQSKRLNHAVEYFQAVLEEENENEEANMGLALTYIELDNKFKAKRHLFRVLSNDPNHEEALNLIRKMVFSDENIFNMTPAESDEEEEDDTEKDFRVANWGDSKQSVVKREGVPDTDNDPDYYGFPDEIVSHPCTVLYKFTDNKLSSGFYSFNIVHSNDNMFINDYQEIVDLLTSKYGEPIEGGRDNTIWFNDLYQDDYDEWGHAISAGHLIFISKWETINSDISCMLSGDNYVIKLSIMYHSKTLFENEQNNTKRNKMKGL